MISSYRDHITPNNILGKRSLFIPSKIFQRTLNDISVTRATGYDLDYTDNKSMGKPENPFE